MENHKYHQKELRTQAKIKKAGFPITLVQAGVATGPEYAPTFGPPIETPLFGLLTRNEQVFRNGQGAVKGDLILMVSTLNVDPENPISAGDTIKIERSAEFPNVTQGEYQIVEIKPLAPAGVPIFYVIGISGRTTG